MILEKKNDIPEIYNNMGIVALEMQKTDLAAAYYERALTLRPDYISALGNLGWARYLQGRISEAIQFTSQAVISRQNDPVLHYNLGLFYLEEGNLEQAIQNYSKASKTSPRDPSALKDLQSAMEFASNRDHFEEIIQKFFVESTEVSEGKQPNTEQ
jgi:tetratricopeptide (TPR) repeat protein